MPTLTDLLEGRAVDLVTCHGTLEHVDDPAAGGAPVGRHSPRRPAQPPRRPAVCRGAGPRSPASSPGRARSSTVTPGAGAVMTVASTFRPRRARPGWSTPGPDRPVRHRRADLHRSGALGRLGLGRRSAGPARARTRGRAAPVAGHAQDRRSCRRLATLTRHGRAVMSRRQFALPTAFGGWSAGRHRVRSARRHGCLLCVRFPCSPDPDLVGTPVIIGAARGARRRPRPPMRPAASGVTSAMPMSRAQRLCPQATVLPPDHELYSRMSSAVAGSSAPGSPPCSSHSRSTRPSSTSRGHPAARAARDNRPTHPRHRPR